MTFPVHAIGHPTDSHALSINVLSIAVIIEIPIITAQFNANAPNRILLSSATSGASVKAKNTTTKFQSVANKRLSATASNISTKSAHNTQNLNGPRISFIKQPDQKNLYHSYICFSNTAQTSQTSKSKFYVGHISKY